MKKAQITRSWVVYPPNYEPGSGKYRTVAFLRRAWAIANAMGVGSEVWLRVNKTFRDGSEESTFGGVIYEVMP